MTSKLIKAVPVTLAILLATPVAAGSMMFPPDIPHGSDFTVDKSAKAKAKAKAARP